MALNTIFSGFIIFHDSVGQNLGRAQVAGFLLHVASAGVNRFVTFSWQQTRLKDPRMYSFVCIICLFPQSSSMCLLSPYGIQWSSLIFTAWQLVSPEKQKWKLPRLLKFSPEWAP